MNNNKNTDAQNFYIIKNNGFQYIFMYDKKFYHISKNAYRALREQAVVAFNIILLLDVMNMS